MYWELTNENKIKLSNNVHNNISNPWTCGKEYVVDKDTMPQRTDENEQTQMQRLVANYERKLKTTKLYYIEKMK